MITKMQIDLTVASMLFFFFFFAMAYHVFS